MSSGSVAGRRAVNGAERQRWNDPRYVQRLLQRERMTSAVTPALLAALAPEPGERLLDVGCGAGSATLRAADIVGPEGAVVGADISAPVVEWAAKRAAETGASNVSFQVSDAQTDRIDAGPFAAAMSQFGVMFFDDPVAAFANIRRHLLPSGRLCFACWQRAEANPWSFRSLLADILPSPPSPPPGKSPTGPFVLADAARVRDVLRAAGFGQIEVAPHETTVDVPEATVFDDDELDLMGVPAERAAEARERIVLHLTRFRLPSGLSRFPLAFLIVTAR